MGIAVRAVTRTGPELAGWLAAGAERDRGGRDAVGCGVTLVDAVVVVVAVRVGVCLGRG